MRLRLGDTYSKLKRQVYACDFHFPLKQGNHFKNAPQCGKRMHKRDVATGYPPKSVVKFITVF